jgi:hypothetical protein
MSTCHKMMETKTTTRTVSHKSQPLASEHMSQVMTTFLIGNYAAPCGGRLRRQSRTGRVEREVKMECNCN